MPDGRHFVSRGRDEASSWRSSYKAPIPTKALASRLGSYVQAYTLYQSVRPFGVAAIIGGWDSEADSGIDGQVGVGPGKGAGGIDETARKGGPGLYMVEPSGLYWVRHIINSGFASTASINMLYLGILWCSDRKRAAGSQSRAGKARFSRWKSFAI